MIPRSIVIEGLYWWGRTISRCIYVWETILKMKWAAFVGYLSRFIQWWKFSLVAIHSAKSTSQNSKRLEMQLKYCERGHGEDQLVQIFRSQLFQHCISPNQLVHKVNLSLWQRIRTGLIFTFKLIQFSTMLYTQKYIYFQYIYITF